MTTQDRELKTRVVFLHGYESSPRGQKVRFLKNAGVDVIAPWLDRDSWDLAVTAARHCIEVYKPDVIVGSSRGGAVAMATNTKVPVVLIAPAWRTWCPWGPTSTRGNAIILHSLTDTVIPYRDSEALSAETGASLIECGEGHRMNDPDALRIMLNAVNAQRTRPQGDV
jgi:predicted alpha/beta hydrolase family esterase